MKKTYRYVVKVLYKPKIPTVLDKQVLVKSEYVLESPTPLTGPELELYKRKLLEHPRIVDVTIERKP